MEGPRLLSTEHHGKCLTCKSFVFLGVLSLSLFLCLSLSLCVSVSLCLCLCVLCVVCCCGGRGGGREGGRRTGEANNRTVWLLIPAKVSLKIAETEQLHQVKRMIGGIGDMLFSICSQTGNVYDPTVSLVNLWRQVRTLRELFMVSRTGDDPPCVDSKTRPCVH